MNAESALPHVELYTDGACSGNPGPGGWGVVMLCHTPEARKTLSGGEPATTNNRMEMMAVISGLQALKTPCSVTITTDSTYIADAFRKRWIDRWQQNGWRTASKQPVKNQDLWEELLTATALHEIRWEWIRGHAGHPENEEADRLAVAAREAVARA